MLLNSSEITQFLITISVMLFSAKLLGEAFIKLKQPAIIGEIIAGVILGPTILGMVAPDFFSKLFLSSNNLSVALESFTLIAVVLLLLVSGLDVDLAMVINQGKKALFTGYFGLFLPFVLGFGVSYFFSETLGMIEGNSKLIYALFMGTALSISALPVIAKTLLDLKIFKSDIGVIIISAAMLTDLIGWIIFSMILGLIGTSGHGFTIIETIVLIIVFVLFMLTIGKNLINRIIPILNKEFSSQGGVLSFILICGFIGAAFTEYIGVHAIFGAFIVGIAIGDSVHVSENTKSIIHQFVTNIFTPLFFVSIGLKINFVQNFDLTIVSIVLILSFIGKVVGSGFGALLSGMNKVDSLIIGFGMNSRGTMEIILGLIALQVGLINNQVFVALVIMALVTSISSPPIMSYFLNKLDKSKLKNLLTEEDIILTDENDKYNLITKLVEFISHKVKTEKDEILKAVLDRENLIPTGIANYLAIPHAKIDIKEPAIVLSINKSGINFNAADGTLSHIVILLLTPKDKNELQLKLLSEISKKFKDKSEIENLLNVNSPKIFIEKFNKLK